MDISQSTEHFTKSLRVLLVEDNDAARQAMADLLNNFFDNITTAEDGVVGLKKFKSNDFDLIVTDINMPNINGLEMIKEIRKQNATIPIIILTAFQEPKYLLESIKYSIDAYIVKPINLEELQKTINKISETLHSFKKNKDYEKHLETLVSLKTQELQELSNRDPMTNLYNRRYFNDIANTLVKLAKRHDEDLAVLMIDIDRFKVINDNYGHLTGDEVLKTTANLLLNATRESDITIRFGGEEFVVLLPDTNLKGTIAIAQKIRTSIEKQEIQTKKGDIIKYTLSIGIAQYVSSSDKDIDDIIHRSDEALYEAKRSGRNKVVVYERELL